MQSKDVYGSRFRAARIALFCSIMIDNSGSMSIYENFIREASIIILEAFRKLECRLAVGRFGNRGASSQKSF